MIWPNFKFKSIDQFERARDWDFGSITPYLKVRKYLGRYLGYRKVKKIGR